MSIALNMYVYVLCVYKLKIIVFNVAHTMMKLKFIIICFNNASSLCFRVPYPFVRASQYPCAVVIKPTSGDFLK